MRPEALRARDMYGVPTNRQGEAPDASGTGADHTMYAEYGGNDT